MTGKNTILTAASTALILEFALGVSPALAQVAAIQSQDINHAGIAADLIEAKRSDGVLSIKVRLKNTGTKLERVHINFGHRPDQFYVQAEGKKYFVLRDTEKVPVGVFENAGLIAPIAPGASFTWWAKYPAPPANVKKFSFNWPLGAPFDDVPITDK
jgi:hypothetical protein